MFDLPFRLFENRFQHELDRAGGHHQIQPNSPSSPLTVDPRLLTRGLSPSTLCSPITPEQLSSSSDPRLVGSTARNDPSPGLSIATPVAFKILDSILPPAVQEAPSFNYIAGPDHRLLLSTQVRRTLLSLSNNLAGTEALSFGNSIRYLGRDTGNALYHSIRSASDHTSRAITRTIFRGAVEAGDASIVHLILNHNTANINPNDEVCIFEDLKYTPIELASKFRHEKVIKVLLKHNVDVRKTFERGDPRYAPAGALECALGKMVQKDHVRLNPSIFKVLHDSGGAIREHWVWDLTLKKDGEFLRDVLSTHTQEHYKDWDKKIFLSALEIIDEQDCMKVIEDLVRVGADLNYLGCEYHGHKGHALIDSAAARGSSKLVQELLQRGAHITHDTLQFAIGSGNLDLIELLLDAGADVNSIGYNGNTSFAAAVRLERPDIRSLIISRGGMSHIRESPYFTAVSQAASEIWDIELIEHLLRINSATNARALGLILLHAVRNEEEDVAKRLIDLGADVETSYHYLAKGQGIYYGPPLYEALERRNSCLAHLLLQVNAAPCITISREPSMSILAIRWGDRSTIKALLFAGASFGGIAFTVAVKQNDQELVQILLDSGVDINSSPRHDDPVTALATAVENENVNMARYLFSRGAEPHDQSALKKCVHSNSREMLDLLLNEHARRYPFGRKGYGSSALLYAVECGQEDVVSMMLKKGADANKLEHNEERHKGWSSAFGEAITKDQPQRTRLIEMFLGAHCDPNGIVSQLEIAVGQGYPPSTTFTRFTALLAAVSTQDVSVAKLLIQHGADVNFPASGPVKRTPLQRAAEVGSMKMVSLLLEHGAEVNAPPARNGGGTALQLAATGGYIAIVWELMTKGADVNAKASALNGRTALEGASEHGRLDMVAVLLKAGAAENGKDHKQLKRAIEFARENGNFHICEFIEDVAGQAFVEDSELVDWDGQAAMVAET